MKDDELMKMEFDELMRIMSENFKGLPDNLEKWDVALIRLAQGIVKCNSRRFTFGKEIMEKIKRGNKDE